MDIVQEPLQPDEVLSSSSSSSSDSDSSVDILDQLVSTYSCQRRTCRWPLALFHNVIDVSASNGFIFWTEVDPTWERGKSCRRRLYLQELGKALTLPHMIQRQHLPRMPADAAMVAQARTQAQDPPPAPDPDPGPAPGPAPTASRRHCFHCPAGKIGLD